MLGDLLLIGEQFLLEREILGRGGAALAGAGDRTHGDDVVLEANQDLGRGADDGKSSRLK